MQVFYLDVAYVYNGFKRFSGGFQVFQTYIAIVVSRCFKTKLDVASPSSSFCCLSLVLGAGSKRRQRRSPLARGRPHVLAGGRSRRYVGRQARDAG